MGYDSDEGRIADDTLAHVYKTIKDSYDGIRVEDIAKVINFSPTQVRYGIYALNEMGCVFKEREGYHVYWKPTEHNCAYCTTVIKYKGDD